MAWADGTRYCIMDVAAATPALIAKPEVQQTNVATLRKNVAGDKVIIKFRWNAVPAECAAGTHYTESEILAILAGTDWTPANSR